MKYAFLDTDFVIKAHIIRKDKDHLLIDQILNKSDYQFCCHLQTLKEIKNHNKSTYNWYQEQIRINRVSLYSDRQILQELKEHFRNEGFSLYSYTDLLKKACNCFSCEYFMKHFGKLDELDYNQLETEEYLRILQNLENAIGKGKSLGEIKTYILMSWLSIKTGEQLLFFCSDDSGARNGTLAMKDICVQCFTIMSSFYWLFKEDHFDEPEARPYLQSMIRFNHDAGVQTLRLRNSSQKNKCISVEFKAVIEDLYNGRLQLAPDGWLIR